MAELQDLTDGQIDTLSEGDVIDDFIALAVGYEDYPDEVPYYSGDISDAWQVVEFLLKKHLMYFNLSYHESLYFVHFSRDKAFNGAGHTASLAICRAALKVMKDNEVRQ
jgi:hypothetical protein